MRYAMLILPLTVVLLFAAQLDTVDIVFSHKTHAANGLECADCHTAASSSRAEDNLLPPAETCYTCHEKSTTECGFCHAGKTENVKAPRITNYIRHFPHDRHAAKGIACLVCHQGVEQSSNAREQHLPKMAQCQSCHPLNGQTTYCTLCHASDERLAPDNHRLDWRTSHGRLSLLQTESCSRCHLQNECLRCHAGDNLDREVHPLNYLRTHGREARSKRDACLTCHDELASCVACHREQMVLPRGHQTAGWSNPRTGGRHARQAKLDLETCLACHSGRPEPSCAECHTRSVR
ncbi:MAG: cytochrome c3 family protein [candidate division KSB1 bacterium]|nr:cytochrome c3 family protein [candidate division KSB1 bacterium]